MSEAILLAEGRSRAAKSAAVWLQRAPDATQLYWTAQVDGAYLPTWQSCHSKASDNHRLPWEESAHPRT